MARRLGAATTSFNDWHKVFQVNFFAPIMLARGLLDELTVAKGAIVNVTSIAGSRVHPFAGAAYATSKAALASLTREMAADFGPLGIRVNSISPGEIDTAILSPGTEKIVATLPLQRLGKTEEVAKRDPFPLHRCFELRHRRRTAHQWRAARVSGSRRADHPLSIGRQGSGSSGPGGVHRGVSRGQGAARHPHQASGRPALVAARRQGRGRRDA